MYILSLSNEGFQFPSDAILPGLKTVLTALTLFNLDFSQAISKRLCEFLTLLLGICKKRKICQNPSVRCSSAEQ